MSQLYTYNPAKVNVALGNHIMTGYAEDTFIIIDPVGDGTTMKTGCDGSVNRSISPVKAYTIKLALQQNSPTNDFLKRQFEMDQGEGSGLFPFIVKDLMGKEQFSAEYAWVPKMASWGRGKEATNREWELACSEGNFDNDN